MDTTRETPSKKSAADGAADRVRGQILRGELPAGRDLPGERGLSEQLGVSRLTLRAALTRLEAEGLVQPVHGSGTRVLDYRETGGVDLIGYLAEQALEGGRVPVRLIADLLEMRRMIAVELLGAVAERATDAELRALRKQVARQELALDEPEAFIAEDLQFARLLVRAGRNLALELLFNTVVKVIDGHPGLAIAFRANADQTVRVYRRLIDLIETRDARRVRKVARRLVGGFDRRTMQRIEEFMAAQGLSSTTDRSAPAQASDGQHEEKHDVGL